jgi:hypothetical protein
VKKEKIRKEREEEAGKGQRKKNYYSYKEINKIMEKDKNVHHYY